MNIYLIGYRCTGKTTLGQALARHLEREFVDMDDLLVAEQGCAITRLVAQKGWPFFRKQEQILLKKLADRSDLVVGTGGGVVLDPANVTLMRSSGKVVWLQCRKQTILRLMQTDPRTGQMRPALTDKGLQDEIEETLTQREPLYRAAAHVAIATDDFDVQRLCCHIIKTLRYFKD